MIDISVLIVNYNTACFIAKCLHFLIAQEGIQFEIIVVDNHSSDESLRVLEQYKEHVKVIANSENHGFGRAHNQAFLHAAGRYVFILNPDAFCLTTKDLLHLCQFMQSHQEYGLIGTRLVNSGQEPVLSVFNHYPRQKQARTDFSNLPGHLAAVLGASMVVRREIFKKIGGFDEDFFLYSEEIDLCLRIRKAGYSIGYCEEVTLQHIGGASEKGSLPEEVIRKKKKSKLLFYSKHYPIKDVIAIVKKDLRMARFHLFRFSLLKIFKRLTKKQELKFKQQKVARELAREFLLRQNLC